MRDVSARARGVWPRRLAWLVGLQAALLICWSGGFVGIRFASTHAPILLILLWRSLVSGLVLLPFALTIGPRLRLRDMPEQIGNGILGMAIYLGAFAFAIGRGVPTGLVALITDMLPLVVALLSWPLLGQALTLRQWLGTSVGVAGVLIASGHALAAGQVPAWAYALPLLGTVSLAVAVLWQQRRRARSMPMHQRLCLQCLTAAAIFAPGAWYQGGMLPPPDPDFIGGILWLVFVATIGGWSLYYLAMRQSSPAQVSMVLYLSPPLVTLWAWAMFGERLSWAMAAGMLVSLHGIVIAARDRSRLPPDEM